MLPCSQDPNYPSSVVGSLASTIQCDMPLGILFWSNHRRRARRKASPKWDTLVNSNAAQGRIAWTPNGQLEQQVELVSLMSAMRHQRCDGDGYMTVVRAIARIESAATKRPLAISKPPISLTLGDPMPRIMLSEVAGTLFGSWHQMAAGGWPESIGSLRHPRCRRQRS